MPIRRNAKTSTGAARIILAFTLLYVVCMGLRVAFFLLDGKSMICAADAQEQHINALIAYGKWMRGIFYTLLHEHRLAFQNYSFGIGYGADFYTSMQYYAVGDPLNLPAAVLPSSFIYYYYQFLILLRPYLAGCSFIALCLYRRKTCFIANLTLSTCGILAGALIYAFSGTVLFIGMWNPFFVTPMITLPLLIRGVDILLREKRCAPFVLAVFLAGVANFYFFYMQVIFLFGYFALNRIFAGKWKTRAEDQQQKDHGVGKQTGLGDTENAIMPFLRFLGSGVLGVCMSGILLLPMFFALLGNPRVGGHELPLLYSGEYYLQLLKNLMFYIYHPLQDTELALTPLVLPALILTLFAARRYDLRRERATLLVLIIMLLVPAAGYVMSGFAYAINRWCFAFALLAAWLVAATWDLWLRKRALSIAGVCAATAFILLNVVLADAPWAGNLPNGFVERMTGEAFLDQMLATEDRALEETVLKDSDSFVRAGGRNLVWNASLLHGLSSTQFYWSLANGAIADLMKETAVNEMANFSYVGLEDRAMLLQTAGVTHYTLRYDTPEEEVYVPALYERAATYYNFAVYENPLQVGLGTVHEKVIPRSDYLQLAPWDREEALTMVAVLDDQDAERAQAAGIVVGTFTDLFTAVPLQVTISAGEGVAWEPEGEGGSFVVTGEEGGRAEIYLDAPVTSAEEPSETALYLGGLNIDGPRDIVNLEVNSLSEASPVCRTISYKTRESEFYSGWHDYLVNFGSRAACNGAAIVFPAPGRYSVEKLTALQRPVGDLYLERAQTMAAHAVTETQLHRNPVSLMTDRVTMEASGPKEGSGLLLLTIPWQRGWHAEVDGVRTSLMRADTAFTGLILGPGHHDIVLSYQTPGLLAGVILSLAGIAAYVVLIRLERRNH